MWCGGIEGRRTTRGGPNDTADCPRAVSSAPPPRPTLLLLLLFVFLQQQQQQQQQAAAQAGRRSFRPPMYEEGRGDSNTLERKLVILGATDVGKTSLAVRYCNNEFLAQTATTIGASFLIKKLALDGKRLTLQIWDTAGQERFRSMAPLYYRNAKAALLVFDWSNAESWGKVRGWVEELRKHVEDDALLAIAANKADKVPAVLWPDVEE